MPLKATVETLDEIEDETQKTLYKETQVKGLDGKPKTVFALELEGADAHPAVMALRNAHERQKTETAKAKARVAELEAKAVDLPEEFSVEEWTRLKAVDEEYKKNPGNPENKKIHEVEVQNIKAMHEQQIARLKAKSDNDLKAANDAHNVTKEALRSRVVGDDLTKALVEAGIDKKFLRAAKALLEKSVKVVEENGTLVATVTTDLTDMPIDQFVPQWAQSDEGKAFVTPATGSGAQGSDGVKNSFTSNPYAKGTWNMTQQVAIFKQDAAKADRMAKAAGHASAIAARLENAK